MVPSLRHLEIFRLFARTANVTHTARFLRMSQPAVSLALKELEAQLGLSLFARSGGRVRLTDDGTAILASVEALLDQVVSLNEHAAKLRGEREVAVSVASVHSLTRRLLPDVMLALRAERPLARFRLEAYSSLAVARQVKQDQADLGLTFLPVDEAGLTVEPILRTALVCLVPTDHPLAARKALTPQDLANEPVIVMGPQTRQEFDVRFTFAQQVTDPKFLNTNDAVVGIDLARRGLGIAVTLPFVLSFESAAEVAAVPFQPEIQRTLVMVRSTERDSKLR
jgi:DNA-binding transcriptional LysR family regulator